MADRNVGGVYLEVGAERERGEPKRTLAEIEAQVEGTEADIKVGADTDGARSGAEALSKWVEKQTAKIDLDVATAAAEAKITNLAQDKKLEVQVDAAVDKAAEKIRTLIKDSKGKEVDLELRIDKDGRGRDQFGRFVSQLNETDIEVALALADGEARERLERFIASGEAQKITVDADADTGSAETQLEFLARDRVARIIADVDTRALDKLTGTIGGLSGLRVMNDFGASLRHTIMNLDRAVPRIMAVVGAMGSLGNAAGAATGSILTIGAGLSQMIGGALAMAPAVLLGFGTGIGVLVAALLDMGDVLGDLAPQFSALQDSISSSFWKRGEAGARMMVDAFMPLANKWLPRVAEELGGLPEYLGAVMSSPVGQGALEAVFSNTVDAIEPMNYAISQLLAGFLRLGGAGAKYLPQMASWFADMGQKFDAWAYKFTETGAFDKWITRAWDNMKAFGSIVGSTGGILGAFADAAEAAGSGGLQGMADGLNVVEEALKGPVWQKGLTTLFEGWNQGVAAMMPGLRDLGDGFLDLTPALKSISITSGEAASAILSGFGAIMSEPAFQSGLTNMFEGVRDGLQSIADVAPQIGKKLGGVMDVLGELARTIGDVLATAIEEFGPALDAVLDAMKAIVPVLGDALIGALETLGPIIGPIVEDLAEWAENNPELASTILAVVGASALLVSGLVKVGGAILPILNMVGKLKDAFSKIKMPKFLSGAGGAGGIGGLGKALGRVGSAASKLAGPIGAVIGLFAAMWTNSEDLRNSISDLVESFLGFASALGSAVMDAFDGIGKALEESGFMDALQEALDFLGEGAGILGDLFGTLIEVVADSFKVLTDLIEGDMEAVVDGVKEMFGDFIDGLGQFLSDGFEWVWELVKTTIGAKLEEIYVMLQTWAADLSEAIMVPLAEMILKVKDFFTGLGESFTAGIDFVKILWEDFWNGLVQKIADWWVEVTTKLTEVWTAIQEAFTLGVELVKLVWNTFWDGLLTKVTEWWIGVTTTLTEIWTSIQEAFTLGVELVKLVWNQFWDGLLLKITEWWIGLTTTLTEIWTSIQETFTLGIELVKMVWNMFWDGLLLKVTEWWISITTALTEIWTSIQETFTLGVELVKLVWNQFWDGLLLKVTEWWIAVTTTIATVWTSIQEAFTLGIELVKMTWNEFWDGLKLKVTEWVLGVVTTITTGWSNIQNAFSLGISLVKMIWDQFWSDLRNAVSNAWTNITTAVQTGITLVQTTITTRLATIGALWSAGWERIRSAADTAWNLITSTVRQAISNVVTAIITGAANMASTMSNAWNTIQSAASTAWSLIQSTVSTAISNLVTTVLTGAADMAARMSEAWNNIQSAASTAWSLIQSTVTQAMIGLVSAIVTGAADALQAFRDLASNALDALRSMVDNAASIGSDVVAGIISGVASKAGSLYSQMRSLASNALSAAKNALNIGSPSKVFRDQVGKWIPEGMAVGIDASAKKAADAARDMALRSTSAAQSAVGTPELGMSSTLAQSLGSALPKSMFEALGAAIAAGLISAVRSSNASIGLDPRSAGMKPTLAAMMAAPSPAAQAPAPVGRGPVADNGTGITREELLEALSAIRVLLDGRELTSGIRESKRRTRDTMPL